MRRRTGVWRRYLFSFVGIAAISALSVALSIFSHDVSRFEEINRQSSREKARVVLEDVVSQCDLLETIADKVSTTYQFQPSYYMRSEYYEIEIANLISNYTSYSPYSETYFLKYNALDKLFMSTGHITYPWVLRKQYAFWEPNEIDARLRELESFQVAALDGKTFLFAYPIRTLGFADGGRAALCFIISPKSIESRCGTVSGGFNGKILLTYGDIALFGDASLAEASAYRAGLDNFTLYLDQSAFDGFSRPFNIFDFTTLWLIACVLLLAALMAYYNYKPIYRITAKYAKNRTKSELASIEDLLNELIYSDTAHKKIRQQLNEIRPFVLRALTSGDKQWESDELTSLFGLNLPGPVYAMLAIQSADKETSELPKTLRMLNDLSSDEMQICAYCEADRIMAIVSLPDRNGEDILDCVSSLLSAGTNSCRIELGLFCDHLDGLWQSREDALRRLNAPQNSAPEPVSNEQLALANGILDYIREHFTDYDICLEQLSEQFGVSISSVTYLVKHTSGSTYKQMLTQLRIDRACALLRETQMPVADICSAVGYANISHFIKLFKSIAGDTPACYRKANAQNHDGGN